MVAIWLVGVAAVLSGTSLALGAKTTNEQEFNTPVESQVALDLLERVRGREPNFESVIVQSDRLVASDPASRRSSGGWSAELNSTKDTVEFAFLDPTLVSADGRTIIVPTKLHGDFTTAAEYVPSFIEALERYDGVEGFTVVRRASVASTTPSHTIAEEDLKSEQFALPVALDRAGPGLRRGGRGAAPAGAGLLAIALATGAIFLLSNLAPFSFFVDQHDLHDRAGGRHRLLAVHHRALPRGAPRPASRSWTPSSAQATRRAGRCCSPASRW